MAYDIPEIGGIRIRGRRWLAIRAAVLTDEPLCRECAKAGKRTPAREVDHIVPIHKTGTNERANLQPLCIPCHKRKTSPRPAIGVDGWPMDREASR